MSYGSPEGVAALASTWTDNGEFLDAPDLYTPGTNPTLSQVEEWLDQVSVFTDIAFAGEGFTVPISHIEVLKAIDLKVNALVADIVHLQHNKGRLFSERVRESGDPALEIIERELASWVKKRANGFENLGIPRVIDLDSNQAYSVPMGRQK